MRYYLDTEFIERFDKPLFGRKRHVIDLISIGIVAEDGRELHLISNEYKYKDASEWVQNNVIIPLYTQTVHCDTRNNIGAEHFHRFYGFSNKQIAEKIAMFVYPEQSKSFEDASTEFLERAIRYGWNGEQPEFYAYFADYDWVLFCSLFGTMMDLPNGFPMYCRDLKQSFDEKAMLLTSLEATKISCPSCTHDMYSFLESKSEFSYKINVLKKHPEYPIQKNEHNALSDARWNKQLYEFLNSTP